MSVPYAVDPTVVSSNIVLPTTLVAPYFILAGQANGIAVCSVVVPRAVTGSPVSVVRLYRSLGGASPVIVDFRYLDRNSTWLNLFDLAPLFGDLVSYSATAVAEDGTESAFSSAQLFTAFANPYPLTPAVGISAGAFGPYPLLGSDIYINPATGDGVIGPNGDLLTVNGLECFAQDLRTRILTELGELVIHPTFGLFFGRTIGSGQSDPLATASLLRTRIIDCIMGDPRTYAIDQVTVIAPSFDAWTISYKVYAIGAEDALEANLVFPFYTTATN